MGVEVGRAVRWGLMALGTPGPPGAGCFSPRPHPHPRWWLGRAWVARDGEAPVVGEGRDLAEAVQTFAQVEVSSVWFRGCA